MKRLEVAFTAILVAAAVVTAAAVASRALAVGGADARAERAPTVSSAQLARAESVSFDFGDATGQASLTVFSDLQCPACRQLHTVLREIQRDTDVGVRLKFVHYPLNYHQHARLLAQLVECSESEQEKSTRIDRAFAVQDSIARLTRAEVISLVLGQSRGDDTCELAPESDPRFWRIAEGRALGDEIGLRGTPTILIDGQVLSRTPTREVLLPALGVEVRGTVRP